MGIKGNVNILEIRDTVMVAENQKIRRKRLRMTSGVDKILHKIHPVRSPLSKMDCSSVTVKDGLTPKLRMKSTEHFLGRTYCQDETVLKAATKCLFSLEKIVQIGDLR